MKNRLEQETKQTTKEQDPVQERDAVAEEQPDWIKEHIAKYGKEPNLFDGC